MSNRKSVTSKTFWRYFITIGYDRDECKHTHGTLEEARACVEDYKNSNRNQKTCRYDTRGIIRVTAEVISDPSRNYSKQVADRDKQSRENLKKGIEEGVRRALYQKLETREIVLKSTRTKLRCAVCKEEVTRSGNAKYCSDKCRQKAYRHRKVGLKKLTKSSSNTKEAIRAKMQLMSTISHETKFIECRNCHKKIERDRRARYCSDNCKIQFHWKTKHL
jgi:hypothetical protein